VKYTFFIVIVLFSVNRCFAQDTIERKNKLTDSVIERFYVLKSAPQVKQGPYKAFFRRKVLIAAGNYKNDKKVGTWNFYATTGNLIEKFNYDTNSLLYEGPLPKGSPIGFLFDEKINKTDTVTRPIKIGGTYYGFIPYLNVFKLPFDTEDINTDFINAIIELLISPGGRLADYKVHLISERYQYDQTFNLSTDLFSEADKTFVPAKLNGRPILCRIMIKCSISHDDGLNFY
jgi:hypothetical protein